MKSMRREKKELEKTRTEKKKSEEIKTEETASANIISGFPYEEVIQRNSETVYRLAYSLVRTRPDADDIYQEVFLRYVRKIPVFDSAEHEKAWFMRVTLNCCKNFWKSPWVRRRNAIGEEEIEQKVLNQGTVTKSADLTADLSMDENQYLIETVRQLPEKYRVVIHMFYYEELSVEEIAEITQSKASTVRTRLTRARRLLKGLLDEKGEDFHV